jgi:hypothetical protein
MARSSKTRSPSRPRKARRSARSAKPTVAKRSVGKGGRASSTRAPARKVASKAKAAARGKPTPRRTGARAAGGLSRTNAAVLSRANARAELDGLLSRLPPPVVPIMKTLRRVVLEAAPEAVERIQGGDAEYFAGGMFARIEPREREVLVTFLKGAKLPSSVVLKTTGRAGSVALSSLDSVRASVLRTLVREAVLLNLEAAPSKARA